MEHVLQNIKRLRIIRNITQAVLAAELDITTRQYNNLETGKSQFSMEQLGIIAQFLDIHIGRLFDKDMFKEWAN